MPPVPWRSHWPEHFPKPEHKEPPAALVGCDQCSGTTALATARKRHPLLDHATPEIGINQTVFHLSDCQTERLIRQFSLAHPADKVARLEDSLHGLHYITKRYSRPQ